MIPSGHFRKPGIHVSMFCGCGKVAGAFGIEKKSKFGGLRPISKLKKKIAMSSQVLFLLRIPLREIKIMGGGNSELLHRGEKN